MMIKQMTYFNLVVPLENAVAEVHNPNKMIKFMVKSIREGYLFQTCSRSKTYSGKSNGLD